jgi:hypothetical protein
MEKHLHLCVLYKKCYNLIDKFTTSVCLWWRFWGWGKGEAGEATGDLSEVLGVRERRGRWSNGRPISNEKPFSFSNQLLHFSLDTICLCVERKRERASLRKIFLIVDYILPGCKGARDGRRSSWWCKKYVLIRVIREPSCVCHLGRHRRHSYSLYSLCTSRL